MAMSDVKLLGAWPSPFVNRVQIALNLKSVDYELIEENFGTKSELLLKSNPVHKKIPVLIHGDKPISESLIIVQYIDELWTSGPTLLPSDPYDRAMARFWAAYIDDKLFPTIKELRSTEAEEAKAAIAQRMTEGLVLLEETFAKCSKGKGFFGGDDIGYLDIAFGSGLAWLRVVEMMTDVKLLDEAKMPGLFGWAERFCSHGAVKDVVPETEKLFNVAKMITAIAKAQ
ncbi:glutathione S-transferase U17-like [Rhododendron vialii]|uniref:glutathione S-transferase U17-like n=1 Tax=Rhododendron vialii TaxID=182163 RepID=UPI00265E466D|nr:glutathione S-transferase U17-like [Rhododendron vialii]